MMRLSFRLTLAGLLRALGAAVHRKADRRDLQKARNKRRKKS